MIDKKDDKTAAMPPEQHGKMAVPPNAPPGVEVDAHGDAIPVAERTKEDRAKAQSSGKKA